jgi:hypothetical protein
MVGRFLPFFFLIKVKWISVVPLFKVMKIAKIFVHGPATQRA